MEIRYERQMCHNYLIVKPDKGQCESYECRMLMENVIEGLLKFRFQQTEDGICYFYEITSKQPLSRMLEGRPVSRNEIVKLISSIAEILDRMEGYLFQESRILLEPEYIYIDPDNFQVFLCLIPGREADFPKNMELLLQYILKKVNHKEKDTVLLVYRLYQESQKEFYGMNDLLKWLSQDREIPAAEEKKETEEPMKPIKEWQEPDSVKGGWENRKKQENWKKRIACTAAVLLAPGAVWFVKGSHFFTEHPMLLIGWYGVWGIVGIIMWIMNRISKMPVEKDSFMYINEKLPEISMPESEVGKPEVLERDLGETGSVMETQILNDHREQKEGMRYLLSLDKRTEDIPIPYFPFIIGKQSGIADFVLNKDAVSRLHVKLEDTGAGYKITDLNSTNGTMVRGMMLQNNETVSLEPGDEIYIADNGFRFI